MKTILTILFAGTSVMMIPSCLNTNAKETGSNRNISSAKETADNIISYKVNGKLVTTSGWNISRFKLTNVSKESLNITTNMHDEKRTININISGTEPGEYSAKPDDISARNFYGSYFPDYVNDVSDNYSFETGTFIITKIDTIKNTFNGTFSGIVRNIEGETFNITDGKIINGKLSPDTIIYE